MTWEQLLNFKRLGAEQKYDSAAIRNKSRSEFDIDFDRIIFSYPFRRLQDKTQVVPLPEHDFVHSRLTHSLEVSSVGRSLGKNIGEFVLEQHPALRELGYTEVDFGAIVAAASLTHDIGNPPFGHAGERALSDHFLQNRPANTTDAEYEDLLKFEGNAQGFRILCDNRLQDLKLTYATLGAFTKYPCESVIDNRDKRKKSQKKFGFFQSEKQEFSKIAEELGLVQQSSVSLTWCRHPLAFLVEAADDICYLIIDLEDAARMKVISLDMFIELVAPIIGSRFDRKRLDTITDENQKIGLLRALAINQLVQECSDVFRDNEAGILAGTFDQSLSDLIPAAAYTQAIADYSFRNIYNSQRVLEIQAAGFEVLPGLLAYFLEAVEDYYHNRKNCSARSLNTVRMLPAAYFSTDNLPESAYLRARQVIDFISGMTDTHAVTFYRKIKGISI